VPLYSPTPQGWYDPATGFWEHPDHYEYFRYNIVDLPDPFLQEAGTIYWLEICPFIQPGTGSWGWKSSEDHFEDDAVWRGAASNWEWIDLWEPPNFVQSLDLAFAISGIAGGCESPPRPDPVGFAPDMWINPPGDSSCMVDSDCHTAASTTPYCIPQEGGAYPGTCYAPTNRYASIARNPSQVANTARRITLQGGGAGPWWVGAPQVVFDPTCLVSLYVADVVNAPVYAGIHFAGDWPDELHVKGCEIAPGGYTYLVQAIESGQDINNETCYSAALPLETAPVWGDVVSTCFYNQCLPPEGGFTQPSIDDVLAMVNRFTGVCNGPLWWFDIDPAVGPGCPEGVMTIGDVLESVNTFTGAGYPGLGPLNCP
jgi:hypothetical protein